VDGRASGPRRGPVADGREERARPGASRRSAGRWLRRALGSAVLLLAAGFAATRVLARSARARYPALGEHVLVDGLRQHVVDRGSGEPVVFVHGAFGALQDFTATLLDVAARRYRCIAWDRPGHGYSERPATEADPGAQADLLAGLIDELELDAPLLVGFSYGGAVALATALRRPERVRGVVLLNGPSHPWPDPIEWTYRLPAVPVLGTLLTETLLTPVGTLLADASVRRAFAPAEVAPAFERSPVALALRPASYRANAEDMRTLKPFLAEQQDRYGELAVPLTIVVASADRVVSPTM